MKLRNRIVKIVNKCIPITAQYYGKMGDKPGVLRPSMNVVAKSNKTDLIGAEVGVKAGINAKKMLDLMNIKKLYLIDPYLPYTESEEKSVDISIFKQEAEKRLSECKNITWIGELSIDATKFIKEELDFVYIDAAHDYENVLQDCRVWYPKIKAGGVMGGHDFVGSQPGLRRAVRAFCKEKKIKLHIKPDDWWVVKNDL